MSTKADKHKNNHVWELTESNSQAKDGFSIAVYTHNDLINKRHSHNFFQIYFINKGSMLHIINNQEVILQQGDIFLVAPNMFHKVSNASNGELQFTAINYEKDFLYEAQMSKGFLPAFINSIAISDKVQALPRVLLENKSLFFTLSTIEEMMSEFEQQEPGYIAYIRGLLTRLIVVMARNYTKTTEHSHNLQSYQEKRNTISRAVNYINENFTKDLKLDTVAKRFTLSRTNFCKYFKLHTGLTFNIYLNNMRINYAKDLLKHSNLDISEIAQISGFYDISSFSRKFKLLTGNPPSLYRKNHTEVTPS